MLGVGWGVKWEVNNSSSGTTHDPSGMSKHQCPVKCTHELRVQGSGWRCGPGSCLHVEEATGMNRTVKKIQGQRRKLNRMVGSEKQQLKQDHEKVQKNKSYESPAPVSREADNN